MSEAEKKKKKVMTFGDWIKKLKDLGKPIESAQDRPTNVNVRKVKAQSEANE